MKTLIVSDTHGTSDNLMRALHREQPVEKIVHLGDLMGLEDTIEELTKVPCFMVKGNCDVYSFLPGESVIMLGAHRTFITHGHYYGVGYGHGEIRRHAESMDCDVVMYGHTHVPELIEEGGITFVNPGSLSKPRQANHLPSYAVAEIDEQGEISFEIKYLQ